MSLQKNGSHTIIDIENRNNQMFFPAVCVRRNVFENVYVCMYALVCLPRKKKKKKKTEQTGVNVKE